MYVEVRGQVVGVSSLLPSCGSRGLNSGHQASWQTNLLVAELSLAPIGFSMAFSYTLSCGKPSSLPSVFLSSPLYPRLNLSIPSIPTPTFTPHLFAVSYTFAFPFPSLPSCFLAVTGLAMFLVGRLWTWGFCIGKAGEYSK